MNIPHFKELEPSLDKIIRILNDLDVVHQQLILEMLVTCHALSMDNLPQSHLVIEGVFKHVRQLTDEISKNKINN